MASYPPPQLTALYMLSAPASAFLLGIVYSFELRKLQARMQSRRGPWLLVPRPLRPMFGFSRILQPLYDILKLLYKETVVPETANKLLFRSAPVAALLFAVAATLFVPIARWSVLGSFEFSLVVLSYLLLGVSFVLIVGGAGSSSPWAAIGARRLAELMLAYEVPLVVGSFSAALMAGSLSLTDIVAAQRSRGPFLLLNPFAAVAVFLSLLGKLHLKPFDIPEAEVEIVAGPLTEYSGKLLGVVEVARTVLLFVGAAFFIDLFLVGASIGGLDALSTVASAVLFVFEGAVLVLLLSVVQAASPRWRVDQAFSFYAKVALAFAALGLLWPYALRSLLPGLLPEA
ncbi:MAG: complex I subunit 1 family protein [Candidatus Bathyarchaeia archaeon]